MWRELRLLFALKLRVLRKMVFDPEPERVLKTLVTVVIVLSFQVAVFYFFRSIFRYLVKVEDIGVVITDRFVSTGFLAFFSMLLISNVITSLSTLYKSAETTFLLSGPLEHISVFAVKFVDNLVYTSWAVVVMGAPIVVAYGAINQYSPWEHAVALVAVLLPFVVLPALVGVGVSIVIFWLAERWRFRSVIIGTVLLAALGGYGFLKLAKPARFAVTVGTDLRALDRFVGRMGAGSFPFTPNYWVSEALRAISRQEDANLWLYVLALSSTLVVLARGLFVLARRLYFRSWLASDGAIGSGRPRMTGATLVARWLGERLFVGRLEALMLKDLRLFFRQPGQWGQFSLLLVLLIIYLFNLRYIPVNLSDPLWKTIISFLNFGFSGYVLATLCVRFAFPAVSLEGPYFWAIGSSPVPMRELFRQKFLSAFVVFFVLAELLAVISNAVLGLSGLMMVLTLGGILLMSVSLVSLSIGMGAIFPDFRERNPGKIASSAGAMLTIVTSLVYVGLMIAIVAVPTHRYSLHLLRGSPFPMRETVAACVTIVVLTAATTYLPMRLGLRALTSRDF